VSCVWVVTYARNSGEETRELNNMKQITFIFIVSIFLVSCYAKSGISDELLEQEVMMAEVQQGATVGSETNTTSSTPPIVKQKTDKEKLEALSPEDPRRQKVMTLTWQIQCQREKIKALGWKYKAALYNDPEYRVALKAIEDLNKKIRQMMLL